MCELSVIDTSGGPFGADWGNVPAWFAAIATGVSLIVVAFNVRATRIDKEREHASKVAAWVSEGMGDASGRFFVTVSNSGSGAVREVRVTHPATKKVLIEVPEIPAGGVAVEELEQVTKGNPFVIDDARQWVVIETPEVKLNPGDAIDVRTLVRLRDLEISLEFRDCLNRRWIIKPDGKIKTLKRERETLYFFSASSLEDALAHAADELRTRLGKRE